MTTCSLYKGAILFLSLIVSGHSIAQNILNKNISLDVNRQRLDNVLEILSNKGNFYFSYNSSAIKKDSLVTITANNKTVREILNTIFSNAYEYRESGNYLILRRAPIKLTLVTNKGITEDKHFAVSGYVLDEETGYMLPNASIYEKTSLASALTNKDGYFKLRMKSKSKYSSLTISKEYYQDTTVTIDPRYNQEISVTIAPLASNDQVTIIRPEVYFAPDSLKLSVRKDSVTTTYTYVKVDSSKVEATPFARFLLTSKQRIQTLNLKKFFTERPFQVSLTPGLSTHGKLSSQVVNNFSFNVFGGYSGGVNGMEIGGLFNIDKKDVRYFQLAGLFNIVGGGMGGMQIAGISNTVLDTATGFQLAGVSNLVKGNLTGFQLGGVYNHVNGTVKGTQTAGVANFARERVTGTQLAGVINFSNKEMRGTQIAGVINYAKKIKGVQIGLINIADSSDGFSIGLINVVLKGYHKLSFSTNEVINANVAFKTGNSKFYSILGAGMNWGQSDEKVYTFGYGLGSELRLGKTFSLNPEITSQYLYLGSWDYLNLLSKFHLNFNVKLGKYVSLFAGPSMSVFYTQQPINISGYKPPTAPTGYNSFDLGSRVQGWIGWNAGINFF
jgi:hypothetical protein